MTSSTPQSQSQPLSSQEEAIKRNTDCVYFLASPLTCKKGSECDYRHSDVARLNPRDCWYWQTSNCLNPKCAFRHPPLDGLLGNQVASSSASVPRPVATVIPVAPNSSTVPCVFFKKGHCVKGDWCPFLHVVPSFSASKPFPAPVAAVASENTTIKASGSGAPKRIIEKNVLPASKPISAASQEKAANDVSASVSAINDSRGHRPSHPISNGNPMRMPDRAQQLHHFGEPEGVNSKDVDEASREPSPGFDVLVDDEGRDPNYYTGDDRYGMPAEHEARNELDIGHSDDYYMVSGIRHLASERHQALSERMSGGSYYENDPHIRPRTLSQIDESDLRHRLTKNKRPNSLRSVIHHEPSHDIQIQGKSFQDTHRDDQHTSLRDNSFGGRLRGRIGLPRRSSSPCDTTLSGGADRGGFSSSHGKMRGMIKSRDEDPFENSQRDHGVSYTRRDIPSLDGNADFPAPKSLSELKNGKNTESTGQTQTDLQFGKRKRVFSGEHPGGGSVSFEGPKSLQEILKRKRDETNGIASTISSAEDEVMKKDSIENETKFAVAYDEPEKLDASDSTLKTDAPMVNGEDDMYVEDGAEENGEDHDYNREDDVELYEDQNTDAVEGQYTDGKDDDADDDDDEDDDDDFAKKMGVVYS